MTTMFFTKSKYTWIINFISDFQFSFCSKDFITHGFFYFESCFQNCFWNLFITSGLSQICNIRNFWKLTSPFSLTTLISYSEKTFWSLKTSFWKKNYLINSKTGIKNVFHVRLASKSLRFMVLGYPSKKYRNYRHVYAWKIVKTIFELVG
jgi:hypothetical protein